MIQREKLQLCIPHSSNQKSNPRLGSGRGRRESQSPLLPRPAPPHDHLWKTSLLLKLSRDSVRLSHQEGLCEFTSLTSFDFHLLLGTQW